MTITTKNARRETYAKIISVQQAFAQVPIRWPGAEEWTTPPAEWWWPTMQHLNSRQASLSCEHGKRRWQRNGILTVVCFAKTFGRAEDMAVALRDEFEGSTTPGAIWFRDATANESTPEGQWQRWDFQVNFQYDQVR